LDSLVNLLRGVTDAANFDGDNVNYDGLIMSLSTTLGLPLVAPGVILSGDSAVPLFETIKVEEHLRSARELFELGHIAPYKLIDKPESYIIYGYGDAEGVFPAEEAYISVPVTPPVIQAPVNALCIASSSEYKEECIQLLSWLYTDPDLTNILLYGLEGLHYGKENESVYIINEDSRGNYFMSPIYSCFHTRASLTSEFSPFYANGVFTRAAEYMEKLTPQANTGFHFDSRGWEDIVLRMDELLFSELTFHYREDNRGTIRTHLFLTGEDPDWEVKLAQLNKTLADAGIHELAAEVDRQYQEWKALYSPVR
jgi:hypothetical protein